MLIKKINKIMFFLVSSVSLASARIPVKYHDLTTSEVPGHMLLKLQEGLKGESWKNLADHPAFGVLDIQAQNPQAKLNVFQKIEQGKLNRGLGNAFAQFYRDRNQHRLRGNNHARLSDSLFQAPVVQAEQKLDLAQAVMGGNLRSHMLHQMQWKKNGQFTGVGPRLDAYYKNLLVR